MLVEHNIKESLVFSNRNKQAGQSFNRSLPKQGETHSSISIIPPINKKLVRLTSFLFMSETVLCILVFRQLNTA